MGIRKSDLKEFIQNKAKQRKDALKEVVRVEIETIITPVIFNAYKEAELVERQGQSFHDSLLQFIEKNKHFDDWNRNRIIRDTNSYVIGMRSDLVQRETNRTASNLLERATNGLMEEVQQYIDQLKLTLAPKITEYQELVKLTNEILVIIDSCHNGDKAYKRLEELGVDLTGFKMASANLPAVIKLSANVCVLNGDCP